MNMKILAYGACIALAIATSASAVTDPFSIVSAAGNGSGTLTFTNPLSGIGEVPTAITGMFKGHIIPGLDFSLGEDGDVYDDWKPSGIDTMSQVDISGFGFTTSTGAKYVLSLVGIGEVQISGPSLPNSVDATFRAGVPEPATWVLMLIGFGAIGGVARFRSRRGLLSSARDLVAVPNRSI